MKQAIFVSLACAGAFFLLQPVLAQIPGGAAGQGPATPSTFPGQGPAPGVGGPQAAGGPPPQPQKFDDKKFAKDAALTAMRNVEMGKLAAQKAVSPDIKQFGKRVVQEQSKASDQLKDIATKENLSIPGAVDPKHQSQIDKLAKLSGEQFDKAYLKDQLKTEQAQLRDFSGEAAGGSDPAVKAFANGTLPALQEQVQLAKNLNKSLKKSKAQ
jgi:putative membrane protein